MSQITQEGILGSIYGCGVEPQIIQDMDLSHAVLFGIYSKIESFRKTGSNPNLTDLFIMIYSTLHESVVKDSSMFNIYH